MKPLAARTAMPVAILRLSPATRTMKNSSRLLAKIARNLVRSSKGSSGSWLRSRTRWLKASQESSRSRKRSSGRSDSELGGKGRSSDMGASALVSEKSWVVTLRWCHRQVNHRLLSRCQLRGVRYMMSVSHRTNPNPSYRRIAGRLEASTYSMTWSSPRRRRW